MNRAVLASGAVLMVLSSQAFAQTVATPPPRPDTDASPTTQTALIGTPAKGDGIRKQLANDLERSGFSDVKIVPGSFIVQAKDKTGNPVTMLLTSDSITEVTDVNSDRQSVETQKSGIEASGGAFANVAVKDDLSSKVVGLDVYNKANQDIGTIKDIAYDSNGVRAYIVGVGGFLGVDERYVALRPRALDLSYNAGEKKWHAVVDANADQLKAAPEYKYPSGL
jgi:hypothetical protein